MYKYVYAPAMPQCPFFGIFVQKLFFIQKAVNLSSKTLLALTKKVSTYFEDFMNISWFYLIKVKFSGHFWPYTLSAPSCTWFLMIGMLVGLKFFIISWVWVHICAPVKFLTFFPTWASNRNLIFQAKLQNSLCSCTSWGYMCNTNEICDTYPESSWYKLLKNARKNWNNHKSYITILDKNTQKRTLWNFEQKSKLQKNTRLKIHKDFFQMIWHPLSMSALLYFYLSANFKDILTSCPLQITTIF